MPRTIATTPTASPATPPQHFATPPLHNATLCHTSATPDRDARTSVTTVRFSTCVFVVWAACYTRDSSPATADAVSPAAAGTSNSAGTAKPPATCSSPSRSLLHARWPSEHVPAGRQHRSGPPLPDSPAPFRISCFVFRVSPLVVYCRSSARCRMSSMPRRAGYGET